MPAAPSGAGKLPLLEAAWNALNARELPRARELCDAVLRSAPKQPDALLLRGILQFKAGELARAEQSVGRALAQKPSFPYAHYTLGLIRLEAKKIRPAALAFRRAVELDASFAPAWSTLALALAQAGETAAALDASERAVALMPMAPEAACVRADILTALGRLPEAIIGYQRAVALAPTHVRASRSLAPLLETTGRLGDAIEVLGRWRDLEPDAIAAHVALGRLLSTVERHDDALAILEAAVARWPDDAELHTALGNTKLTALGLVADGLAHVRRAAALAPIAFYDSMVVFNLHYASDLSADALHAEHLAWQRRHELPIAPAVLPKRTADPERPLRIGFVSADLYEHSVGRFLLPLLQAIDRERFVVAAYNVVNRNRDTLTEAIEHTVDRWRSIEWPADAPIAILDDKIDILVDLAGHTRGDLLSIFAQKCAPLQVSWLGYPNSTGLSRIDYRLTDAIVDPPDQTTPSSETRSGCPTGSIASCRGGLRPSPGRCRRARMASSRSDP
ncbi:MAG: tetratricopeptide repeat protein [Pseudomonadota bacterium]